MSGQAKRWVMKDADIGLSLHHRKLIWSVKSDVAGVLRVQDHGRECEAKTF